MGFETLHNENQFFKRNRVAVAGRTVEFLANDKRLPEPQLKNDELPAIPQEMYLVGGNYGLWTPEQALKRVWYDASDTTTITASGNDVSQIADLSGFDAHSISQVSPKTGTRTIGGLNVLDFDYGDWMSCTSNFSTPDSGEMMVFMVAQPDARSRELFQDSLFALKKSTDNAVWIGIFPYSTTEFNGLTVFRSSDGIWGDPYQNPPHNGPSIYGFDKRPTGGFVSYVDGTDVYPDMGLDEWVEQSLDIIWLGRSPYLQVTYMDFAMGEFLVVPKVDLNTRQKIEGYLAWKWGLVANLPASHPYKLKPPYLT